MYTPASSSLWLRAAPDGITSQAFLHCYYTDMPPPVARKGPQAKKCHWKVEVQPPTMVRPRGTNSICYTLFPQPQNVDKTYFSGCYRMSHNVHYLPGYQEASRAGLYSSPIKPMPFQRLLPFSFYLCKHVGKSTQIMCTM